MEHPYSQELSAVLKGLDNLIAETEKNLEQPELVLIKERITSALKREKEFLDFQLGIESNERSKIANPERVTSFLGTKIEAKKPIDVEGEEEENTPAAPAKVVNLLQQEAMELKAKLPALIEAFLAEDTDLIVDNFADIEVRAIAKEAGLPVTEHEPDKIDAAFIEVVKKAWAEKKSIAEAVNKQEEKTPAAPAEKNAEPSKQKKG